MDRRFYHGLTVIPHILRIIVDPITLKCLMLIQARIQDFVKGGRGRPADFSDLYIVGTPRKCFSQNRPAGNALSGRGAG